MPHEPRASEGYYIMFSRSFALFFLFWSLTVGQSIKNQVTKSTIEAEPSVQP